MNRGMLADNTEYEKFMSEVVSVEMPAACRIIFADLLMAVAVPNAPLLWDCISQKLSQDFSHKHRFNDLVTIPICCRHALWCVNDYLLQQGCSLQQFGFPLDSYCRSADLAGDHRPSSTSRLVCSAMSDFSESMVANLNVGQLSFIECIRRIIEIKSPSNKCVMLQAPGGTGKTHTMNVAIKMMLQADMKIAVTSSTGLHTLNSFIAHLSIHHFVVMLHSAGISATALVGGRTVHSAFNAGIVVPDAGCSFSIETQSVLAKEWRSVNVLIIDEVMCLHRRFIEAIEHTFHHNIFIDDVKRRQLGRFCGVIVIVSGDPRQQLPISPGSDRFTLSSIGFHNSSVFDLFEQFSLTENVRIHPSVTVTHKDQSIQPLHQWILNVGDGLHQSNDIVVDGCLFVSIPPQFYCGDQLDALLDRIYGHEDSGQLIIEPQFFADRVILTPLYKDVRLINSKMQRRYEQLGHVVHMVNSHDSVTGKFGDVEDANTYSASLFPEHCLQLFIGCPVMCLRKYNNQLANGDRAVVQSISTYRLGLRVLTGQSIGKLVHLPRMLFTPSNVSMKIQMNRLQFGVVVAFGITVSKSQSCGFNNVGVWLNDHLFAHGHLYLALSRLIVKHDGVFQLLFASRCNFMLDGRGVFAMNTVYDDVLAAYKSNGDQLPAHAAI